jgi:hypothetical protein
MTWEPIEFLPRPRREYLPGSGPTLFTPEPTTLDTVEREALHDYYDTPREPDSDLIS